jgi:FMN phosphatase YigB (HAD superfamily)
MIQALLFDLGKVLVDFDFELGMREFAAKTPLTRQEFELVIWDKHWIRRYERGEISTSDYHQHLCQRGKLRMNIQEFEAVEYFHHRILSHEVGSLKPDVGIYRAAIQASGKAPEALFFADDREENIEAARALGIRAHLFRSVSGLVDALKDEGVEVGEL